MPKLSKRLKRRVVRYGVLAINAAILLAVAGFVWKSSGSGVSAQQSARLVSSSEVMTNPLDQLSSADIAVHVARMVNLPESASVTNNADSLNAQLAISSNDQTIVTKPQIAATDTKSRKDVVRYVTVAGDTVAAMATKFGVTSESIRWSNSLTSDVIAAGKELFIPPRNGIVYTVKAGDTADTLASKYRANRDQIVTFNDAEVTGVVAGERIVIPDGSIQAIPVTYNAGFAFGTTAIYSSNGYDYGWCTWYVANRRRDLGNPVPSNLGNANTWYIVAQRAGLSTGSTPVNGAVAVNQGGNHVMVVEQVNADGSFWVSEMNASGQISIDNPARTGGWGRMDHRLIPSAGNLKFIY